jgi:hypothetical protein
MNKGLQVRERRGQLRRRKQIQCKRAGGIEEEREWLEVEGGGERTHREQVVGSGGRKVENAQGAPALLILERRGRGVPAGPHGVGSKDGPSEATRPAAGLMFCKPPVPNTAITDDDEVNQSGKAV